MTNVEFRGRTYRIDFNAIAWVTMRHGATAVAVLTASWAMIGPTIDARAQEYIAEVMAPTVQQLTAQVEQLTAQSAAQTEQVEQLTESIQTLIRGQSAETTQSEEEARIGRQILCLQELQVDPSRGSVEECTRIP